MDIRRHSETPVNPDTMAHNSYSAIKQWLAKNKYIFVLNGQFSQRT